MESQPYKVLVWNVRGLNSPARRSALYQVVDMVKLAIVCLQETKLSECPRNLIKSICPMGFDQFIESPSRGASGGILTVWHSDVFKGALVEVKPFGMIISFNSVHNNDQWFLVNVYAPCQGEMRDEFVN